MANTKVWNPLKKSYWTKENLRPDVAGAKAELAKLKEIDWSEKTEAQEKADALSKKIMRLGWKLMLGLTVPILLTVFLGVFGFIVGAVVFCLVMFKK